VLIGASSFGLFLAGEIIAFTAKPKGAEVELGRGLGTVECAKTVLAVHAPISFALLEANEAAEERPAILNRDPYDAGWMVRGRPTAWEAERTRLADAAAYRAHVRRIEPAAEFL
jgi:glycine cleavage system H protein